MVTLMAIAALDGAEDVPLILGCNATFDKQTFRYATECEAHLKRLIDLEPQRAFLHVRLGNLYRNVGRKKWAQTAYERAIELDPKDIEAHGSLAEVFRENGRLSKAVAHWHAVLKHAREARQVKPVLRRNLVRAAIESLLEAHAESQGKIDLLPTVTPEELPKERGDEPIVLELREFDLGTERGINDLCDTFLEPPRRRGLDLFGRGKERVPGMSSDRWRSPSHRDTWSVGRNDPCPCGSGRKYKKCCGRWPDCVPAAYERAGTGPAAERRSLAGFGHLTLIGASAVNEYGGRYDRPDRAALGRSAPGGLVKQTTTPKSGKAHLRSRA